MRNPVNIDQTHSREVCREVGERLRFYYLKAEPELPTNFKEQIDRLREFECESPSIVPAMDDNNSSDDEAEQTEGGLFGGKRVGLITHDWSKRYPWMIEVARKFRSRRSSRRETAHEHRDADL